MVVVVVEKEEEEDLAAPRIGRFFLFLLGLNEVVIFPGSR